MQFELYQEETSRIAKEHSALLKDVREQLLLGKKLSRLEQKGVLHAVQVLIENAIGKAKHILKAKGEPVPVSAYDAFAALAQIKVITEVNLPAWNAAIGLRNRIVHEYMNLDIERVLELVQKDQHRFVTEFLLMPFSEK